VALVGVGCFQNSGDELAEFVIERGWVRLLASSEFRCCLEHRVLVASGLATEIEPGGEEKQLSLG
jgi:hypothetical protein